jgi:protein-tyrosine phosphatase
LVSCLRRDKADDSSAGVGRTGTFIALSSLLLPSKGDIKLPESPLGPLPEVLRGDAVAETVDEIREWRGMLVQNEEQLKLIYDLVR